MATAAAYHTTVVKQTEADGPLPEDAGAKTHHVRDHEGKTVKFQNPYPSFKAPDVALRDFLGLLW